MRAVSLEQNEAYGSTSFDWSRIVLELARHQDLLSVKILEKIYVNPGEPYVIDALRRQIKPLVTGKTMRRHAKKLEQLGLIRIAGKSPMSLWPVGSVTSAQILRTKRLVYGYVLGEADGNRD